jgi:hypothetical protein
VEPQPLPAGDAGLPATPLTAALAPGSLTSYGPDSVRLPPAPATVSATGVALLGWLVPGLGQVATGRRRAGLALLLTIGSLFLGGLTLADFSCVDPQRHRLEFVAHSLIGGPTAATLALTAGRRSAAQPRWRDLGSLYVVVSGFLNLIAVCSAMSDAARQNQERRRKHEEAVRLALAVARLQALARRPLVETVEGEPVEGETVGPSMADRGPLSWEAPPTASAAPISEADTPSPQAPADLSAPEPAAAPAIPDPVTPPAPPGPSDAAPAPVEQRSPPEAAPDESLRAPRSAEGRP